MPASAKQSYSRYATAALELLGTLIRSERTARRTTAVEFAERLGVDRATLRRLEQGNPKIELGLAFEACAMLGIPLFEESMRGVAARLDEANKRLSLLPKRARAKQMNVDDDF